MEVKFQLATVFLYDWRGILTSHELRPWSTREDILLGPVELVPPPRLTFLPEAVLVGDRITLRGTLFSLRPHAPVTERIFYPSVLKLISKN